MAPGNGKITMRLTVRSPFTFIDSQSDEAKLCLNSPFITNPLSATLLNSDPCYARGSAPGNYNLECLQQIFQNNSCGLFPATLDKSAYPSTNAKAATLMYDSAAGRNRTIAEIADFVYQKALVTVTGGLDSNGADLSISEWSAASLFCSGIPINSPCDRNSASGPLSDDCITDLWDNKGENNINGATYNLTSLARSLFSSGNTNRFCTRMGSLSPRDVNGNIRPVGMNHWKTKGGVAAVKAAMSKLHSDANTSLTNEDTKSASINQCYGIIPSSGPSYTSSYTTPPMAEVLTRNTILKTDITIPENYNYSLSFDITPYGITFGNYGGIIRITSSKTSNSFPPAYGERSPMIIFSPNSLEPYIILGDDGGSWQSWNWGVPPSEFPSLPLNQKSTIRINATGSSVLVSVRGVTKTYTQPNKRTFSRNANEKYTFYASDDTFPAANAMIENILYKINDTIIVQTPPAPAPASGPGQSL